LGSEKGEKKRGKLTGLILSATQFKPLSIVDHDRMARYRQDVVHGIWA
jgi:hypothetical protein